MITVETYADLPRKIGAHAFVILGLLQAAKMAGEAPTTAQWLFDHAPGFGTGTITAALRKLTAEDIQLAVRVTGGWVLNEQGAFQLPLGYTLVDEQKAGENRSGSDSRDGPGRSLADQNRSGSDFEGRGGQVIDVLPEGSKPGIAPGAIPGFENEQKAGENRSQSDSHERKTGSIKIIKTLINDDDELNLNLKSSSSSILNPKTFDAPIEPGAQVRHVTEIEEIIHFDADEKHPFPSVKLLLESMEILFDDTLDPELFDANLSPKLALAWIIKAYLDKKRNPDGFRNPLGMIRRRLEAHTPRKISKLEEMPDAFLEAIGLWEGRCSFCGTGFYTRAALNEHLMSGHDGACDEDEPVKDPKPIYERFEPDPEFDASASMVKNMAVVDLWLDVISKLQQEMPRASFETWVKGTRPVGWDQETGLLTIGTRNSYACQWLDSRLADTVTRILSMSLGRKIAVKFVVCALGSGEE